MIAHVAEASEASGRVLFWLEPERTMASSAIEGAVRLAEAFKSEIETLVVNDGAITRAKDLSVARFCGNVRSDLSVAGAGQNFSSLGQRQRREVETAASKRGVPCHHTITAGDAIDQLTGMCQMTGPWNIIAMAQEPVPAMAETIGAIMANVSGATGVVVAPSGVHRPGAPVAVIVEDVQRLSAMLRAGQQLNTTGARMHVFLAAETLDALAELESHVRLVLLNRRDVVLEAATPTYDIEGTLDERLRRLAPSYVVARFGGALLKTPRALVRTIKFTGAPYLLVR